MNYELAKQLKDAGFPQKHEPFCVKIPMELDTLGNQIRYFMPSLSELIEACGDRLQALERTGLGWRALVSPIRESAMGIHGLTPEEAVANLWLKIHEKHKQNL